MAEIDWLLVIDLPDERNGMSHIHVWFEERAAARKVVSMLDEQFGIRHHMIVDWTHSLAACPTCGLRPIDVARFAEGAES